MRFGTIFGTATVSNEWSTTEGATTTSSWRATTETAPMSSDATPAIVSTTIVSPTTETVGTTEALTTTTTTTTAQLGNSSSGIFREELDDELRDSYPAAGNNSIARQKSVQAAQQNATLNGNSRNISRNSHKLRVNMKGPEGQSIR